MGQIVSTLLNRLYTKVVTPVIVEFTTAEAMTQALPDLTTFLSVTELTPLTTPAPFPIATRLRERIISRFQNPLLAVKTIPAFNMTALPLRAENIEEIAAWPEVTKIYPDKMMYALSAPPFPTVPPEGTYTSPTGVNFTTTMWTRQLIGADIANQQGWTGQGVTACVIDSGYDFISAD